MSHHTLDISAGANGLGHVGCNPKSAADSIIRAMSTTAGPKDPYEGAEKTVLQAIGLVIVNFSQLEDLLRLGISALLVGSKNDDAPDLVTSKLSFRSLIDVYGCLFSLRFPNESPDAMLEECKRLEDVNEHRNRIVHSFWGTGATATTLTQLRTQVRRKGMVESKLQVSENELLEFATEIDEAYRRFSHLLVPVILGADEQLPK